MAKRKDHAIFRPGFLRWEIRNGKLDRMPQCAGFLKLNSQMIQKHLARMQTTKRNSQWASKVCWNLLPTPNNFEFWTKWLKMSPFLGAGEEWGDEGTNPKPIKKFNYGAITWDCFSSGSKVFWPPLLNRKKTISIFFLATLRQLFASHQGVFVPCDHLVTKGPLVHIGLKCVSVLSYDSFASIGSFCWTPWSPDHLFKF